MKTIVKGTNDLYSSSVSESTSPSVSSSVTRYTPKLRQDIAIFWMEEVLPVLIFALIVIITFLTAFYIFTL